MGLDPKFYVSRTVNRLTMPCVDRKPSQSRRASSTFERYFDMNKLLAALIAAAFATAGAFAADAKKEEAKPAAAAASAAKKDAKKEDKKAAAPAASAAKK